MARVTLKDVAARAGVSYQTVSKIMHGRARVSDETADRVWAAVRDLGYKPNINARNLRTQRSNLIGYAWRLAEEQFFHPILDGFLASAAKGVESNGYHLLTFITGGGSDPLDPTPYQELYGRGLAEGFILADSNYNDPRIRFLLDSNIPFACFGRANEEWDFCWVDVDGQAGIRQVVDHLVGQGHQKIAMISWPDGSQAGAKRELGYQNGLRDNNLPLDPRWIIRGENTVHFGASATQHLLDLPQEARPTAIVCITDMVAIGSMSCAAQNGYVVGQDIAVTGYDNVPLTEYLQPALTSVQQPIKEIGERVVDLLMRQIRGENIEQKGVLVKPELIIRHSG